MSSHRRRSHLLALGGLTVAACALIAAGPGETPPDEQITCPLHGPVSRGGPRQLRLEPAGTTRAALTRGGVALGDELQLTASFEVPGPRNWLTALPGTKLATTLSQQDLPGEYTMPPRRGEGTLLLIPRGAEILEVVLRTAAGELKLAPSALRERLPAKRALPAGTLAVPLQTARFTEGQRAEVAIRLRAGQAGSGQQGLALVAELDLRLDPANPEVPLVDQEHSFGRAALLFDVADDEALRVASLYASIDRQRQRLGRDVDFLLDRRLSASTREASRFQPLSAQELEAVAAQPLSDVIVDVRQRKLTPGTPAQGGSR